jgi:hypothetical protein
LPIDGQVEILNAAILAEYLVKVIFIDILRQALNDNLAVELD